MGMIVTTPMLSKGQNAPLPEEATGIDVVLGWTESDIEVDASALLLGAGGKVGSDADFVFYNQPESADGSVRFLGRSTTEDGAQARIAIDLTTVPAGVETIALAGSVATGTFGDLGKLAFRVVDSAGYLLAEYVTADATVESAFVFGEIYRRSPPPGAREKSAGVREFAPPSGWPANPSRSSSNSPRSTPGSPRDCSRCSGSGRARSRNSAPPRR